MVLDAKESRRRWRESAYYWSKHRNTIEQMFAPATQALIQKAEITKGDEILDVAGGMGEPSLSIAERYGGNVAITFTDIIWEMIEASCREANNRKLQRIRFCRCSGDQLPFKDQSFDVIVSRFGIMFFPDPAKSLRDMLRVLKPEGRISIAVWHHRKNNPVHEFFMQAVEQLFPVEPIPPDAPDAFRFGDEGKLAALVKNAGFSNVEEHVTDILMVADLNFENFFEYRSEISDSLRDKIHTLSSDQKNRLYENLHTKFEPYFDSGQMRIPGKIILITAQK
ncbi:class I SAM-dependent methyltransferase [bacterium]|nr:class I SAM-dependent methyltransferase [bacterium]